MENKIKKLKNSIEIGVKRDSLSKVIYQIDTTYDYETIVDTILLKYLNKDMEFLSYGIVHNNLIDIYRKVKLKTHITSCDELKEDIAYEHTNNEDKILFEEVMNYLKNNNMEHYTLIRLLYIEKMKWVDISKIMNKTVAQIKYMHEKIINILKEKFKEYH